ncbi:MAG: VWA domain-containing protein [Deltaproteobacteria bacterium]|nr:VWA domain-containing protein [Deltaproteobacteria bacterium]
MNFAPLTSAANALLHAPLEELSLSRPWWLLLWLTLVPAALMLFSPNARSSLQLPRTEALFQLAAGPGVFWWAVARVSFLLALFFAVCALAGPQAQGEPDPGTMEGIDIAVVLDVSGSMRAADFKPKDRLNVAKSLISDHVFQRKQDRISLVIFAAEAVTQTPLTHDTRLLKTILDGVRTGVLRDGTAIGDATAMGVNRLRDSEAVSKALILVTDGDNNAGKLSPEKATSLAKAFGVRIFPILVGRGGRVPMPQGTDFLGATRHVYVNVPTNPKLLKQMAHDSDGRFFTAVSPEELAGSLQKILEEMDKTKLIGGPMLRRPVPLYALFLLLSLFCLFLYFSLSTTRASSVP